MEGYSGQMMIAAFDFSNFRFDSLYLELVAGFALASGSVLSCGA